MAQFNYSVRVPNHRKILHTQTHTQMFYGFFPKKTWVSWYQKDKPFWILLKQEMMGCQWHQLNHMPIICTSLQTDNYASISSLHIFTGWMPFLPPNQQRQSTEGTGKILHMGGISGFQRVSGTTDWKTQNSWNIDLLTDSAELIPVNVSLGQNVSTVFMPNTAECTAEYVIYMTYFNSFTAILPYSVWQLWHQKV